MNTFKLTKCLLVISLFFGCAVFANAVNIDVTIYGKGGIKGEGGSNGGSAEICPQKDDAVCAKLVLSLYEVPYVRDFAEEAIFSGESEIVPGVVRIFLYGNQKTVSAIIEQADFNYIDMYSGTADVENLEVKLIK